LLHPPSFPTRRSSDLGGGEACLLRIGAPPALESPHAIVPDAQPRDTVPRPARLAGLEIEEALEHRRRAGPVGLAFAAIEQDHDRRARTDLVVALARRTRAAARGAPVAARPTRLLRTRTALRGLPRPLGLRRPLGRPRRGRSRSSRAEAPAPRT